MIAHAVGGKPFGRQFDDIIGKELERKQTLSARVDDQRRLGYPCIEDAHALPWIFAEKPDANVEHGPADQIDGLEPRLVKFRGDILHHRRGHSRCPQTLVAIANGNIDQADFSPHTDLVYPEGSGSTVSAQRV